MPACCASHVLHSWQYVDRRCTVVVAACRATQTVPLTFYRDSHMSAEEYARIHIDFRDKGRSKHAARFVDKTEPNHLYGGARPAKPVPCSSMTVCDPVAHDQV